MGDVQIGEGVTGLRQAFELTGTQTVVAMLWKIPDNQTAQLVTDFFDHLTAGQSKAAALGNAQLNIVALHRRQHHAAHPFYGAAFTLTGDLSVRTGNDTRCQDIPNGMSDDAGRGTWRPLPLAEALRSTGPWSRSPQNQD